MVKKQEDVTGKPISLATITWSRSSPCLSWTVERITSLISLSPVHPYRQSVSSGVRIILLNINLNVQILHFNPYTASHHTKWHSSISLLPSRPQPQGPPLGFLSLPCLLLLHSFPRLPLLWLKRSSHPPFLIASSLYFKSCLMCQYVYKL